MNVLDMCRQAKSDWGFTLIELVIVIALLGILAVAALPRMMSSYEGAHESAVTATGGALASAVILVRSQWISNGANGAVDSLEGYGEADVATSEQGWPTDAGQGNQSDHSSNISGDAARCQRIWQSLLVDNAPRVSVVPNEIGSDYFVEAPSGAICRYSYIHTQSNSRIEYNLSSGSVVTVL